MADDGKSVAGDGNLEVDNCEAVVMADDVESVEASDGN